MGRGTVRNKKLLTQFSNLKWKWQNHKILSNLLQLSFRRKCAVIVRILLSMSNSNSFGRKSDCESAVTHEDWSLVPYVGQRSWRIFPLFFSAKPGKQNPERTSMNVRSTVTVLKKAYATSWKRNISWMMLAITLACSSLNMVQFFRHYAKC